MFSHTQIYIDVYIYVYLYMLYAFTHTHTHTQTCFSYNVYYIIIYKQYIGIGRVVEEKLRILMQYDVTSRHFEGSIKALIRHLALVFEGLLS
jgi:hypothetical protein